MLICIVIFIHSIYNKSVMIQHIYVDKNVKERVYGTNDFAEAVRLEEFSLP